MKLLFTAVALLFCTALSAQLPSYVPTSSLVAWYSFNGNANDLSGNGFNGTLLNGVAATSDRFGSSNAAYNFDGIDDAIYINNANFFNIGWNEYTVSGWVDLTAIANPHNGNQDHILFNTSPHQGLGIAMDWGGSNKYTWSLGNGSSWTTLNAATTQTLVASTWKMMTLVKSASNYSLFIDGAFDHSITVTSTPTVLCKGYIGSTDPLAATEVMYGKIDDFGVWNRALNQCEITQLFTTTASSLSISAASSSSSVCSGQTAVLTASGAVSYVWSPGGISGASISVTPSASTTYTVVGTGTCGSGSAVLTQVILSPPQIFAVSNSQNICTGSSATLVATGASSYQWNPGQLSGQSVVVTPGTSLVYTVTGTDASGCSGVTTLTLNMLPLPQVSGTSSSAGVCSGQTATLSATGASNYQWNPGALNGAAVAVTSTVNQTYTVTGTDASTGCSNTSTVALHVFSLPQISAVATSSIICRNTVTSIGASGADSYQWMPGGMSGAVVAINPTVTTTYTITGTFLATGCSNTATVVETVSACLGLTGLAENTTGLHLYPNPNNGEFTVQTQQNMHLVIVNSLGQLVRAIDLADHNDHQLTVSGLESGIYFITSGSGKGMKIVVSK